MIRDDTRSDDELQQRLSALGREDSMSATFTDRVLLDLGQRGLVRQSGRGRTGARWWAIGAAAAGLFGAGIGVGSAMRDAPTSPQPTATTPGGTAEVNVPRVGQSEVWF